MNKAKVISVSELAVMLQKIIDEEPALANLWVRAEISNFKKHSAGHLYLSIKDEKSSIRAVMFKSRAANLKFIPKDGMDCLLRGYVSVYSRDVMVQFYIEEIIPAGLGMQHIAIEELKKKLQGKGYFAAERKRPLPFLPKGIGVVTSPVGAAIRDICKVIERRYPGMPVVLYPALVQGDKAAESIAAGIEALGLRDEIDVIIVGRGGGSIEDLGVFNAEIVADSVFLCPKPVISAVGHEIDFTITDLVADLRAATPSVAGELAVPVKSEILKALDKFNEKLYHVLESRFEREQMRLGYLTESAVLKRPERWLGEYQEELDKKDFALSDFLDRLYQEKQQELQRLAGQLQALSPLATLARGYSISKDEKGRVVNDSRKVNINDKVEIQLYSGKLGCIVTYREDNNK